jgi:hypothetical protein
MPVAYEEILGRYEKQQLIKKLNSEARLNSIDNKGLSPNSSPFRHPDAHSPKGGISDQADVEAPSIADLFIEQNQLGRCLEDALELRKYLEAQESEYARREKRRELCEKTGTAEERRKRKKNKKPIPLPIIDYVPREFLEKRDKTKRVGNAMVNEHALDPNFGTVERILKWVVFEPLCVSDGAKTSKGKEGTDGDAITEVTVETHVGYLVKGLFWGHEHLKESA